MKTLLTKPRGGRRAAGRRPAARRVAGCLIAVVLAVLTAPAVGAQIVQPEPTLGDLELALQQRVGALTALANPSKLQKKEAKALGKGLQLFDKYVGLDDKKDFKTLGKIAAAVSKSKTGDARVLEQVEAIRDVVEGAGLDARQVVLTTEVLLMDAKTVASMAKLLVKGDKQHAKGEELWPVNRAKGIKKFAAATAAYRKAAERAVDTQEDEADEFPNDVRPTGITVQTAQPEINHPVVVDVHYQLDRDVPDMTLALYANSVRQAADPDGGGQVPATQWLVGQATLQDVSAGGGTHRFQRAIPLWMERQDLVKGPPVPTDTGVGSAVEVDGDTAAIVSTISGTTRRVALYGRDVGGLGDWGQSASIEVQGSISEVGLSGDTLVVGQIDRVVVYERNAGGTGQWGTTAVLERAGVRFGESVDVSGDWIVVGAPGEDVNGVIDSGAIYTFRRDQGGPGNWGQVARHTMLETALVQQASANFGSSVAIDDDVLVAGAPFYDTFLSNSGQAILFDLPAGASTWDYVEYLNGLPTLHTALDGRFGWSVAVDDGTIAVGAAYDSPFGVSDAGSAHVFEYDGGFASYVTRLVSHNPQDTDLLGWSVAVAGDVIAVGSLRDDGSDGAVYLYVRHQGGEDEWGQLERLPSPFPGTTGLFSWELAAHGDVIVVGTIASNTGAVIYPGMLPVIEGDYVFSAVADPHDRILERPLPAAEDNNVFTQPAPVRFEGEAINMPNLVLESVEVTPNVVFLDTEAKPAATFGVNVKASLHGNFDGPLSGVGFVLGLGSLEGLGVGHYIPSTIWDEAQQDYVEVYELPDMVVGEPVELHLDVRFERKDITSANVGNFIVDMPGGLIAPPGLSEFNPANPSNPTADNDVPLTSFPGLTVVEPVTCSFSESYVKGVGNDDFGATVDFQASIDLTRDIPGTKTIQGAGDLYEGSEASRGVVAAVHGGIDAQLFGLSDGPRGADNGVELVGFKTLVERDPVANYGFLGSELVYLDPTTLQRQVVYSVGPYDTIDLEGITKLPDGVEYDSSKGEISFTKTFQVSKRTEKEKTFFPAGVPVTVEGAVEGGIGFEAKLTIGDALVVEAYPFARLFGTVELDVAGGLAGAEGTLTLADVKFRAAAGLGMEVVESGNNQALDAAMCFKVGIELVLLNGKLSVFVRYPAIKWCDTFFGDVPCGFRLRKASLDLIDWTAFTFCKTFVDEVEDLCCEWLVGQMICPGGKSTICNSEACSD